MTPDPLDRKLEDYARQPLPAAPADMSVEVWRAIEQRRTVAQFPWDGLLSPRMAVAGLVFALLAGVIPALAFAKVQASKRLASDSLHLDAFSTRGAAQVVSLAQGAQRHTP